MRAPGMQPMTTDWAGRRFVIGRRPMRHHHVEVDVDVAVGRAAAAASAAIDAAAPTVASIPWQLLSIVSIA